MGVRILARSALQSGISLHNLIAGCGFLFAAGIASAAEAAPRVSSEAAPRTSLAMVSIVLPRDLAPGDRFRASVVADAGALAAVPGLRILEAVVPLADGPSGRPTLDGLLIECGLGRPQSAVLPLVCAVSAASTEATFVFSRSAQGAPVARVFSPVESGGGSAVSLFSAPPISVAGAVQVVEGPFGSGDPAVEVDGRPANLIAASPRALYWGLPQGTPLGQNRVVVRAGGRPFAIPIWVVRLSLMADRLSLEAGESTGFHAVLSGLAAIPDSLWQRGFASRLLDRARIDELSGTAAKDLSERSPGVILLAIENGSRDAISLEDSVRERIVLEVSPRDLSEGVFRYDGRIRSRRAGTFAISAAVLPLLRAVPGRELSIGGDAAETEAPATRP